MTERPLKRLSNLELIDIISHPERFTEEIQSDAREELRIRKEENQNTSSRTAVFGSVSDTMLFKTSAIATPIIVWMNLIIFVVVGLFGVDYFSPNIFSLFKVGGMQQYHFLNGDWWRPLTSMFLHAGVMHIGFNMYALLNIGPLAEHLIGSKRYTVIYILCGLLGSLASIGFGSDSVGVGASGAIFGIFGLTYILLKSPKLQGDKKQINGMARQLGFFIILNIVIGMSAKSISNEAHVGGLVTGAVLAFIYLINYPIAYRKIAGNVVAISLSLSVYFFWVSNMTPRHTIIAEELRIPQEIRQSYGGIPSRLMYYENALENSELKATDSLNYYLPLIKKTLPEYQILLESNTNENFDSYIDLLEEKINSIENLQQQ